MHATTAQWRITSVTRPETVTGESSHPCGASDRAGVVLVLLRRRWGKGWGCPICRDGGDEVGGTPSRTPSLYLRVPRSRVRRAFPRFFSPSSLSHSDGGDGVGGDPTTRSGLRGHLGVLFYPAECGPNPVTSVTQRQNVCRTGLGAVSGSSRARQLRHSPPPRPSQLRVSTAGRCCRPAATPSARGAASASRGTSPPSVYGTQPAAETPNRAPSCCARARSPTL
jgi:hypothetical protein